jgi:branched-chain amino acid transport system ATP-binding protein
MLQLDGVTKRFGGYVALDAVSLDVPDHGIMSLIGPNGSGKSTLFNIINGILRPNGGRVLLDGEDITDLPPHLIAVRGIARTFQMTRIFPSLTTIDNLLIFEHTQVRAGIWDLALRLPAARRDERKLRERAEATLDFVGLAKYRKHAASALSVGQRRLLQLAMGLVSESKILMLDEPAAGLSPPNTDKLIELLLRIRQDHRLTILLVEHSMALVMAVSDRVAVLNFGQKIAEGTPLEVRENAAVLEAYLGQRAAPATHH